MFKKVVLVTIVLLLCSGFFGFTGKLAYSQAHPELVADKSVNKAEAYLGEAVTVTIDVEGTGTPIIEPDFRAADIVIMMDTSGSYNREIQDMKDKFSGLLLDLAATGLDIRVGFIVFGNFHYLGECPINTDGSVNAKGVRQLTSDTGSIVSFINSFMAVGQWEPWGDAIWLGNNWMNWRPEAYKIVVLATDEPCDEGRRVPGPLGRVTGTDYDGTALWNQVLLAASNDIIYITIDSGIDLTTTQLKKVSQLTGGLYYNFSHAQAEQFVSVINATVAEVVQGERWETAGHNVQVTDIVNPEVEILPGTFNIPPTTQTTNPDGSVTLTWNLGDIKYNEATTITYQVRMIRCGSIPTNLAANVTYLDWEENPSAIQLPLPVVSVPCPTIESADSAGNRKDTFNIDDKVYVNGTGYAPSTTYSLYIVDDVTAWIDGMSMPSRVPGTITTVNSTSLGNIMAMTGWNNPLKPGSFDIVVDLDDNGVYNERTDALDDSDIEITAGFFVIPEYAIGTIMALTSFFAALALFHKSRNTTKPTKV